MITTINLRNLHLSPYKATKEFFFLGMKTFKIYSPSNFQICSMVLLTTVNILGEVCFCILVYSSPCAGCLGG